MNSAETKNDFVSDQFVKRELKVLKSKKWDATGECIRLLDLAEMNSVKWGTAMILQVVEYTTGEWKTLGVDGKILIKSLGAWYSFVRTELEFDGAVRVAVAGA